MLEYFVFLRRMKMFDMKRRLVFVCLCLCVVISSAAKQFTLVLDPGHGGTDPGAVGTSAKEKDLNLKVALLVGEKISERCPDVKIIYTRKTDKTVPLKDRPMIANKANGDLFVSIHTNSSDSRIPCGTETYVIGLAKIGTNFEVAKRENSVILLEKDRESYHGFDPNSPESYIMFEFMQDQYMEQSLQMADFIQQNFSKKTDRTDRGVRQDLFWVLHQTKMPSVLVEMGFVSNASDQTYMLSKQGQDAIAESIVCAFEQYKHEFDKKNGLKFKQDTLPQKQISAEETDSGKPVFKLQLFVSKEVLPENHASLKGEKNLSYYEENGLIKYTIGETTSFKEIKNLKKELDKKFSDSFIIAFLNGEKISVKEALSLLK